ncbi:phasin family protein [Tateyamaria sp. SN3-11]|uniref:phasin family protein n=1 Tax=Tateyamaria sp. SN3-11 TaxID=3092147 RepID=UPI0039E9D7FD
MTKSQKSETSASVEPEKVFQSLTDVQMAGLGSLSWLGTKWVETMSDFGAEWLHFVAERVKEDVKTQHELLHAKNMGDVQHIQATFLQKAIDDYQNETGKIVQFCSDTMADIQAKAADQSKT